MSTGLHSPDLDLGCPRSTRTGFVTHFQKQIVRAHFALIKLKMKHTYVLFDCFMYGNIRNVYINKAQNISLQEQVLSVLKLSLIHISEPTRPP